MTTKPVSMSVVGHTNTGKTSFLRTLLKNPHFGEVAATPSTTRDVSMAQLIAGTEVVAELFDTPGLEDSQALYMHLQQYVNAQNKHNSPAVLASFLQSPQANNEFEQEAKVIRQLLHTDLALFVIDTRTPVLEKYLDELAILRMAAKPIIPVLNFINENSDLAPWQSALARVNLHNSVLFDTQSTSLAHETRLLEQCIAAMPIAREPLQRLLKTRAQEQHFKTTAAANLLAELLVNVGAYQTAVRLDDSADVAAAQQHFKQTVINAENKALQDILAVFGFQLGDARLEQLPIENGHWQQHSFDTDAWRALGVEAGTGVVAGGTVGAGIDLMVGGASLGAGTLIGAMVGGMYQGSKKFSRQLQAKFSGKELMQADQQVLELLFKRQLLLIQALATRGHAAISPVYLKLSNGLVVDKSLKKLLQAIPRQVNWSALSGAHSHSSDRSAFIKKLSDQIGALIETSSDYYLSGN
ncbi:DUF3482 domain-containing protein [Aliidiomarina quisquiliarum]|uniref:GTPase/DUF3482 domain-containing protein n=1 Tax=Aliidiomarina quisquiliarum TaxID=2938947 RepID=UPI00208FAAFF|nr:DUF3482 domain-containing protein [Aliidiomarina quisquiliarum]MCO4320779.1 DUF3482 domain-containing protein [Aliidiomarina quisquiliarum]